MDRNLVLAIVLSLGIIVLWDALYTGPQRKSFEEARRAEQAQSLQTGAEQPSDDSDVHGLDSFVPASGILTVEGALDLSEDTRIPVVTDTLEGSLNLRGGQIDDLLLRRYRVSTADGSPPVRLLAPRQTGHGHYVQSGWITEGKAGENALWTAPAGAVLTPQTPVTLTRKDGGLVFEKTISVDDRYMFTVVQSVRNESTQDKGLTPYTIVIQRNTPQDYGSQMILHEGPLGVVDGVLYERKYKTLREKPEKKNLEISGRGGWLGITNKYWLAAVVPPENEEIQVSLANIGTAGEPVFRSGYVLSTRTLAPGEELDLVSYVYGGPKDVGILRSYEAGTDTAVPPVAGFDKAVDWGHLFFLTRPIFATLDFFGKLTGNFGIAILILTLIVKAILFPLANKGYESMSRMKKLQPEIEKLRKRHAGDHAKQQQEMMALYKKEKMNPVAGCLPILLQMPIFFALYKTLFVTIELRHQPFLYIRDLSARDPTSIFNLFGLLPYDPLSVPLVGTLLGIGILPLLMGVSMWFQMRLNPPPPDPVQAKVFAFMPLVFVFIFAPFAAGLVLYWLWNTVLSVMQQVYIMKRHGVEIEWGERFRFLTKIFSNGKKPPASGG